MCCTCLCRSLFITSQDLLALEVVVDPDLLAEAGLYVGVSLPQVPHNPEWLAEEWRERAACFAVLDTLQRYAKLTKGWSILPGSTKETFLLYPFVEFAFV